MDYFKFFNLPVCFFLDEENLRQQFYRNSRLYHPDFFTLEGEAKQAKILELSSLNNQAYRTLSDFDKRMEYVLNLKGVIREEGKNEVPQDFLMEMMDFNEMLMELEFDFDQAKYREALGRLNEIESKLLEEVKPVLENYDDEKATAGELNTVKDFFFKKRYIWRIKENLDRFAPA
jgi:molecular chaperone HscB